MIEDEAWPSAQAFTSWAKSVTGVAVHLEVDRDGRAAQLGVGGGAGVGVGQPADAGDIARQLEDPLVVDVVQHEIRCPGRRSERPWRLGFTVLYMDSNGGKTARRSPTAARIWNTGSAAGVLFDRDSGARRPPAPSAR